MRRVILSGRRSIVWGVLAFFAGGIGADAFGQDANHLLPIARIQEILRYEDFDVLEVFPSRSRPGERTHRITVDADGDILNVKYAPAPRGGSNWNNQPRYEVAAFVVQQLFLLEEEWVVPPTAVRAFSQAEVLEVLEQAPGDTRPSSPNPTFDAWDIVLVALQYWLFNVELPEELFDQDRIESDAAYERFLGNFNLLTHLIHHSDSNEGNFLISGSVSLPRVFSVDNGVAFGARESDRGREWRDLRLDRYPADAIDRLRSWTDEAELQEKFGVLVELVLTEGRFVEVAPTANIDPGDGVRHDETRIQLGLTEGEIRQLHRRIVRLLDRVDDGRYELVP